LSLNLDQLSGDAKAARRRLAIEEYRDLDREKEWKRGGETGSSPTLKWEYRRETLRKMAGRPSG
jgi:hypothetical protein